MRGISVVLGAALLSLAAGSAFADCMTATQAYSYGKDVGVTTCDEAQAQYADQVIVTSPGPSDMTICDTTAVLNCKAGFKAGFRSGSAKYIAGIYVPSCSTLLDSYGGTYATLYSTTQVETCRRQ